MLPKAIKPNRAIKFHIISLGCPKNLVDSEVMAAELEKSKFQQTSNMKEAEIVIINTCAFIVPAKEESIEEILKAALLKKKKEGRCRLLIVTGCLPQRYKYDLADALPEVDLFIGTSEWPAIPLFVNLLMKGKNEVPKIIIGSPKFLMTCHFKRKLFTPAHIAYLKIADGCSNRCSYCVIPDIRGPLRSRHPEDITKEAQNLVSMGVKELIIVAQDTTAYGTDIWGTSRLIDLLEKLNSIRGIRWIRLLYTYPTKISDDLLKSIVQMDKLCPYLDMPVQHADDTILKAMNRKGSVKEIREIVDKTRTLIPDVALRTSLIVGFPGEMRNHFQRLLRFIREVQFDHLGAFIYSPEEGTPASLMKSTVPDKTKKRRWQKIMEEQAIISTEINNRLIGTKQEVIIDGKSDIPEFPYLGRCRRQAPEIDGVTYVKGENLSPGDIVTCRIVRSDTYDLFGEVENR
ncbi:MAG: 30S ribosomal protein S12 methylthiotransferase RimO [Syntrophales bacterium]|nr:30S ribosomal protein S12 methylthiotransferase RimO [Syntrophales bacterium]